MHFWVHSYKIVFLKTFLLFCAQNYRPETHDMSHLESFGMSYDPVVHGFRMYINIGGNSKLFWWCFLSDTFAVHSVISIHPTGWRYIAFEYFYWRLSRVRLVSVYVFEISLSSSKRIERKKDFNIATNLVIIRNVAMNFCEPC